jgi:hypothetical protein
LVVAADLINRGIHLPEMMREDQFRRLVLDRLLDEYRAGTPGWLDWWNQLLDLIAAVGPTAAHSSFAEAASTFLGKPTDEVIRAIDVLHARGLLSQRGVRHDGRPVRVAGIPTASGNPTPAPRPERLTISDVPHAATVGPCQDTRRSSGRARRLNPRGAPAAGFFPTS